MREFISGIAMLLLFCVILCQFTMNQVTHTELLNVQQDIEFFLQEIKQTGGCDTFPQAFTDQKNRREILIQNIREDLGDPVANVTVEIRNEVGEEIGSGNPVPRGGLISYRIIVPLNHLISVGFGADETWSQKQKTYEGKVSSEYVSW